jgi:hypothetical protein
MQDENDAHENQVISEPTADCVIVCTEKRVLKKDEQKFMQKKREGLYNAEN